MRSGNRSTGPSPTASAANLLCTAAWRLFVVSSAACALTTSVNVLSAFRFLQAIAACGGAVVSRAMVRDLFPPVELRRIFSMLMLVLGVSPLIAPFIGGYLLVWFGWQSIFLTQASLGALTLITMHFRSGRIASARAREAARNEPRHFELPVSSARTGLFSERLSFAGSVRRACLPISQARLSCSSISSKCRRSNLAGFSR